MTRCAGATETGARTIRYTHPPKNWPALRSHVWKCSIEKTTKQSQQVNNSRVREKKKCNKLMAFVTIKKVRSRISVVSKTIVFQSLFDFNISHRTRLISQLL